MILGAFLDTARLSARRGQVLFYPRHVPPGIFVVTRGSVCRFADGTQPEAGCGDRLDSATGPFALPAPAELTEPAKAGVIVTSDAEILFIPRSVALGGAAIGPILAAADIAVFPLGAVPRSTR